MSAVEYVKDGNVGPARPRGVATLHHVNLKTTRKDEMVAWYQKVLGMEVTLDVPIGAFMTNDEANHRIALAVVPGITPDENRRFHDGIHHTAFEFATFEELNEFYLRMRDEGIVPGVCIEHRTAWSYYYTDPDGNHVEMQVDDRGDWGTSKRQLQEQTLTEHFFGISVDPALVAEAAAAGADFPEIRRRAAEFEFCTGERKDFGTPEPIPDFALRY